MLHVVETDPIFGIEQNAGGHGKHSQARRRGALLQELDAVFEERSIAAETIYDEATDECPLPWREQIERSANGCEDAATINVGDQ